MDSNSSNRGSTGQLSSTGNSIGTISGGGAVAVAGMHHSLSTPAGVDSGGGATTGVPSTPKKGGKMLAIRVQMLDDTVTIFQVQVRKFDREMERSEFAKRENRILSMAIS